MTALATPRAGHAAFLTTLRPGVPAKPMTLFVNKATLEEGTHSTMTWGPAQAGVASGVMWAVADGIVPADRVDDLVLIAAVWVNPRPQTRPWSTRTTERPPGTPWLPAHGGCPRSTRPSNTATGLSTPTTCRPG